MALVVTLPNLLELAEWPFPVKINPHYEQVKAETKAWLDSFHCCRNEKFRETSRRLKGTLLVALTFQECSKEHLRLASDLNEWYFLLDDVTDTSDLVEARRLVQILVKVLRNPWEQLSFYDPPVAHIIKDIWIRILQFSIPSSAARLRKSLIEYIKGVLVEAEDRTNHHIRAIDLYLDLRRRTSGAKAVFHTCSLNVEIPEKMLNHPRVRELTLDGMNLISIQNDIASYKAERAAGLHGHNLITAVMWEKNLDVQRALDYCGRMFAQTARKFLDNLRTMPDFSPQSNEALSHHTLGMARWVSGIVEWSFQNERYFGTDGENVRKCGIITLAPEPEGREYCTIIPEKDITMHDGHVLRMSRSWIRRDMVPVQA